MIEDLAVGLSSFLLALTVVGPMCVYCMMYEFIYVLCEVAIVSHLCISFPYVLHGLYEDYLTCDIAFNAVVPLSRASTRGRYSRIEGVTSTPSCPSV